MSMGMGQFVRGMVEHLEGRKARQVQKCAKGISDHGEYQKTVGMIAGLEEAIRELTEYHQKYGEADPDE